MHSLEDLTAGTRQLVPLLDYMQLRVVAAVPGSATVEIPQGPNGNHFGAVYAGALFSIGEVLGGIIPMVTWEAPGYVPLVKDLQISFRRPAKGVVRASASLGDEDVQRVADAVAAGDPKVAFVLAATLTDEAGTVVATTVGSYQLRLL